MKKFWILILKVLKNRRQRLDFKKTDEYKDALEYNLCNEKGVLFIPKAKYTRFAVAKYEITSSYQDNWKRFDRIFIDKNGKAIPYKTFMQSYRDQDDNYIITKNQKDFPKLMPK